MPHVASELWEVVGHADARRPRPRGPSRTRRRWRARRVELPVQVNGKVRARVTVAADATADDVLAAALADERVRAQLGGRPVRKHVLVPGRMVSLVV